MKNRRVRFTETAQQHVQLEKTWWLENREHTDVFAEELEQALTVVAALPGAGTLYPHSPVAGVRRIAIEALESHEADIGVIDNMQ